MTIAITGMGSTFSLETSAGSGIFAAVAEVTNIKPPSDSINIIDATSYASLNNTKEFLRGMIDPGDAGFDFNFLPGGAGDVAVRAWRTAGDTRKCRITWPNAVTWTFSGFLTGYTPNAPMEDKMSASVTIKVTGTTTVA